MVDIEGFSFRRLLVQLVPGATILLAMILSLIPLPWPAVDHGVAPFMLACVFVWAIYRPEALPLAFVFVVGVLFDALIGGALGLNACLMVAVYWPVALQRRLFLREPFPFLWLGFAVLLLGTEVVRWLVVAALTFSLPPVTSSLASVLIGCAIFPLIGWLLIQLNHRLSRMMA